MCGRLKHIAKQDIVLSRLYHHINNRLLDYFDEHLKPRGLNLTTWTALIVLYSRAGQMVRPSELSSYLQSSRTNITRVTDELVNAGLIERQPDEVDRRQLLLRLTQKGLDTVTELQAVQTRKHEALWSGFDATEKNEMEALLRKLLGQLDGMRQDRA